MKIQVRYYDGVQNIEYQAWLLPHPDGVIVEYDGQRRQYDIDDMTYIGALGDVPPVIELSDDARIEFLNHDVPNWVQSEHRAFSEHIHKIEKSWRWIAVSFVAMLMVVFVTFKWGIPYSAHYVAKHLPSNTLKILGNQAEELIIEQTNVSKLDAKQQQHIQKLYQRNIKVKYPAKIVFREGGSLLNANALAIPNNTIMLTDELVKLTKNDNELLGVLLHEQGHLEDKHSLQQALQSLGISILYVAVTGDAVSVLNTLPIAIISMQYSQDFETQADLYAVKKMQGLNISPHYLADFLQRLSQESGEEEQEDVPDFLQSHPATAKRIAQINAQSK